MGENVKYLEQLLKNVLWSTKFYDFANVKNLPFSNIPFWFTFLVKKSVIRKFVSFRI